MIYGAKCSTVRRFLRRLSGSDANREMDRKRSVEGGCWVQIPSADRPASDPPMPHLRNVHFRAVFLYIGREDVLNSQAVTLMV